MKVYIAGQISGLEYHEAKENFDTVEMRLREAGVSDVFNPMSEVPVHITWAQQMEICFHNLAKCDMVIFQSNWRSSVGARREFEEASRLKKHIRYDRSNDYNDISQMVFTEKQKQQLVDLGGQN